MGETKEKVSTAAEVLERFKLKTAIEEFGGLKFKICKLPTGTMFTAEMLAIPFIKEAMTKWETLSPDERSAESMKIVADPSYKKILKKAAVLEGVLEPKFSDLVPCPEGCLPYDQVDEDLKDFLAGKVLALSNLDNKASEFFRASVGK